MLKCFQNELIALIVKTEEELEQVKKYMDFTKIEEVPDEDFELINGVYKIGDELLSTLKSNKKQEINQAREQARIDEGAVYSDDTYDIDDKAQSNILAKVTTASLSSDDSIFTYRSKTNITHTFTKAEIIALGLAIGDKIDKVYEKSWQLKKKVDEATTIEEIAEITW